ncbi:MAG: T9SS type A sorting domain-containing protein [Bacteroidia bacterium]
MRNKLLIIGLISTLVSQSCSAQLQFQKYFSDLTEYQALSTSAFDNSYVIAASTSSKEGLNFSAVKMNTHGEVIWHKTYTSPNDDYLTNMVITPSGDILLAGYKLNSDGNFDFSLMKLNASGNLKWYKTYGTANIDISVYMGITAVGDLFIVGNTETDTNKYISVLKVNKEGDIIWNKMYGSSFGLNTNINALAATVTKNGDIAVFGIDNYKSYLIRINTDGSINFTALHSDIISAFEGNSCIKQTNDEGFIFCGKVKDCSLDLCTYRFALMKMDKNGNISWSKSENQKYTGQGKNIFETADGGFVSIGQLSDTNSSKLTVLKTDAKGLLLWTKTYGSVDSYGEYAGMDTTSNNGFIFLGFEDSKALFIKSNENGNSKCNEQLLNPTFVNAPIPKPISATFPELTVKNITTTIACTENELLVQNSFVCNDALAIENHKDNDKFFVYPNPFKESTVIEISDLNLSTKNLRVNLYNAIGKKVMMQNILLNNNRIVIPRNGIPNGIYFYEIRNENLILGHGKLIAE